MNFYCCDILALAGSSGPEQVRSESVPAPEEEEVQP